jgi:hypothetical protein
MEVPLKYKGIDYKARSVFCGPNFTFVIGQTKTTSPMINFEKHELEILEPLREILFKKGTLAYFFGLAGKPKQ